MDWKPVTSSNVEAVSHDPETSTLHVRFKGGGVYRYADVPAEKHATMMDPIKTPSIGSFIHANIKGKHAHTKVDPE